MSKHLPLQLLFCLALAADVAFGHEQDVLLLSDDDFLDTLRAYDTTLVMFYAPWCGHCQKLAPEYVKAAELLRYDDPPIALAMVDCTATGKRTCDTYAVQAYPTLKIFHRDEIGGQYHGPRKAAGIARYMRAQVFGVANREMRAVDEIQQLFGSAKLLGYLSGMEAPQPQTFLLSPDEQREPYRRLGHNGDAKNFSAYTRRPRACAVDNSLHDFVLQLLDGALACCFKSGKPIAVTVGNQSAVRNNKDTVCTRWCGKRLLSIYKQPKTAGYEVNEFGGLIAKQAAHAQTLQGHEHSIKAEL